jgi:hypothetical protein
MWIGSFSWTTWTKIIFSQTEEEDGLQWEISARLVALLLDRLPAFCLRWATAIIRKLHLVSWDLCQYRNNRLHGEAGTLALARHSVLDLRITEEFHLGALCHLIQDTTILAIIR